jgi:hypothetical protein
MSEATDDPADDRSVKFNILNDDVPMNANNMVTYILFNTLLPFSLVRILSFPSLSGVSL